MDIVKRSLWLQLLMVFLVPVVGMALGIVAIIILQIDQTDYGNLTVNLFFLIGVIVLIFVFKFSSENLGLRFIREQMQKHVFLSLAIFVFYLLIYVFVFRISSLKPFSSGTLWGLVTYLIVVFAEELYFRGVLYSFFEKRFSAKTALIASSILFGLFHAQQGLRGMISKTFTGWLWGSIRYSTGMIYLLIIPVHFAYNSIWLLFEGNWNNPPTWAIYVLPAIELVIGLVIVFLHDGQAKNHLENL